MVDAAEQVAGPYHQLGQRTPHAPDDGRWAFQSLFALRREIAGGTSEVQRNITGERLLALPRERQGNERFCRRVTPAR